MPVAFSELCSNTKIPFWEVKSGDLRDPGAGWAVGLPSGQYTCPQDPAMTARPVWVWDNDPVPLTQRFRVLFRFGGSFRIRR